MWHLQFVLNWLVRVLSLGEFNVSVDFDRSNNTHRRAGR